MQPASLHTNNEITDARRLCWEEHLSALRNDADRRGEFEARRLVYGDVSMRFYLEKKGLPGPKGYPVYIALHGGGSCPSGLNDRQWQHQFHYYFDSVKDGVCVAPRGIRDTWNTHFNPESYPLYDRLIADLAAYENVDLNRVYLMGFSAGGDGVYGITPYMADRFAAANMSAGHPNSIDLTNLYHLPLTLQVGEDDTAYGRNEMTARYGLYLDRLSAAHGGFEHQVFIHYKKPHNFRDNEPGRALQQTIADYGAWLSDGEETTATVNTNAVDFVSRYTRDPLPSRVIWNLASRAPKRDVCSHYWLWADPSVSSGQLTVSIDRESNSVSVEDSSAHGDIRILVNEQMLDVFRPVTVRYPCKTKTVRLTPDPELIRRTTEERGDFHYQFCAQIALEL